MGCFYSQLFLNIVFQVLEPCVELLHIKAQSLTTDPQERANVTAFWGCYHLHIPWQDMNTATDGAV